MFGQHLADFQLTQAAFGDMAAAIDAGALLTYRASWQRDVQGLRTTRAAGDWSSSAASPPTRARSLRARRPRTLVVERSVFFVASRSRWATAPTKVSRFDGVTVFAMVRLEMPQRSSKAPSSIARP